MLALAFIVLRITHEAALSIPIPCMQPTQLHVKARHGSRSNSKYCGRRFTPISKTAELILFRHIIYDSRGQSRQVTISNIKLRPTSLSCWLSICLQTSNYIIPSTTQRAFEVLKQGQQTPYILHFTPILRETSVPSSCPNPLCLKSPRYSRKQAPPSTRN